MNTEKTRLCKRKSVLFCQSLARRWCFQPTPECEKRFSDPWLKGGKRASEDEWVLLEGRKDASFRSVFFFFEMRFCCWCTHTRAQIQTPINWDWSPACPCFLEFSPNELPWGERSSFLPVCHIQFIHPLSCFNPVNTCRPFLSFRFCAKENICWWHHFEERLNDF